jgi:hypothetical protein
MSPPKPFIELELRPVEAPSYATAGARVFMLLPTVDELLGVPAFGHPRPITLPEVSPRLRGGWAVVSQTTRRDWTVH